MELKNLEDDNNRETFDDADERGYVKDNDKNDKVDYERILLGVVENNIPGVSNRLPGVPNFDEEDNPSDYPTNVLTDGHDPTNGPTNEPTYPKLIESKLIKSEQVLVVFK